MKHFLSVYLVILCLIISGIFVYALLDYIKDSRNNNNGEPTDITTQIVEISDSLESEAKPSSAPETLPSKISIKDLVDQQLGSGSKITVMGPNGVQRFPCLNCRETHCNTQIILACENTENYGYRCVLSASINNPVSDDLSQLPFANGNITLEREEVFETPFGQPMIKDLDTGIFLDTDTYVALLAILDYYSGNKEYEYYLENPLADSEIDHVYINTAPHFTPL